jgi:predicted nucleic acid-binding protein
VTVVSNSSPLISLAKIEMFHLGELYGKIIISAEVYAEVVIAGAGLRLIRNIGCLVDS